MGIPISLNEHLEDLRKLLLYERKRAKAGIDALRQNHASMIEATRQSVADDEHDPEGSTVSTERQQTTALLASAQRHIVEVDAALARFENARYGRCEHCESPIAVGRLLARPTARTCITCAVSGGA